MTLDFAALSFATRRQGAWHSDEKSYRCPERVALVVAGVDVLVNSAAHGPRAPVLEPTDAQWHTGLDIYLLNVVRTTRLVTPVMVKQGAASSSTSSDEIAATVAFLASEGAAYIAGQNIRVDGGLMRSV